MEIISWKYLNPETKFLFFVIRLFLLPFLKHILGFIVVLILSVYSLTLMDIHTNTVFRWPVQSASTIQNRLGPINSLLYVYINSDIPNIKPTNSLIYLSLPESDQYHDLSDSPLLQVTSDKLRPSRPTPLNLHKRICFQS